MDVFHVFYFRGLLVRDAQTEQAHEPPAEFITEEAADWTAALARAEALLAEEGPRLGFCAILRNGRARLTHIGLRRMLADRRIGREGTRRYLEPDDENDE